MNLGAEYDYKGIVFTETATVEIAERMKEEASREASLGWELVSFAIAKDVYVHAIYRRRRA